jgi:MFS family permease
LSNQLPIPKVEKIPLFYGYIVVVCIFFIMMMVFGSLFAFGVFFKPVSETTNWSRAAISGASSLSCVIVGLSGLLLGGLNDRIGPRKILMLSGILMGAGFILMSQLNNLWQLYLFYGIIIGLGQGASYVPTLSTVVRWFTKRRSLMTGIVLIGASIGTIISPPIANRIIELYGWQTSYLLLGVVILVIIFIAAQFLKRDPSVIGLKPYGEEENLEGKVHQRDYTFQESLHTRQFWTVICMEFIFGYVIFAIMVHLVPHAIDLGISPGTAALMLTVVGVSGIAGRLILGPIGDKLGNKYVLLFGFIILAIDFIWLIFIKESLHLYIFSALFGFIYGGVQSSESPIVAWLFGTKSHGKIFGVACLAFALGSATGIFTAGLIFDVFNSYTMAIYVMATASIIGLILSTTLKPTTREKHQ